MLNGIIKSVKPSSNNAFQWVLGLNKAHTAYVEPTVGIVGTEVEGRVRVDSSLLWTTPLSVCAVLTEQGLPDVSLLVEAAPLLMASLFRSTASTKAKAYFASIELHAGDSFANPFANKVKTGREPVKGIMRDNYLYRLDIAPEIVAELQHMFMAQVAQAGITKLGGGSGLSQLLSKAKSFDDIAEAV
jgi:hypothetical protein